MTCEQCIERLSEAVDGALASDEQAPIDAHCRECEACRGLLSDLRAIRMAAASLDRRLPSADVWSAITAAIDAPPRRSSSVGMQRNTTWWGVAAAAALALMVGAASWFDLASRWPRPATSTLELTRTAASELQLAEQHYENAIDSLEQLAANRDALDPAVAAEIAESLRSIDRAIDDSRAALRTDPDSLVAQTSLLEALRMKVALLQETVSLMNAS